MEFETRLSNASAAAAQCVNLLRWSLKRQALASFGEGINGVNLLRWSLKRFAPASPISNFQVCKFTPMEFETWGQHGAFCEGRRVNLLRWSSKPIRARGRIRFSAACKFTPMEFETAGELF